FLCHDRENGTQGSAVFHNRRGFRTTASSRVLSQTLLPNYQTPDITGPRGERYPAAAGVELVWDLAVRQGAEVGFARAGKLGCWGMGIQRYWACEPAEGPCIAIRSAESEPLVRRLGVSAGGSFTLPNDFARTGALQPAVPGGGVQPIQPSGGWRRV